MLHEQPLPPPVVVSIVPVLLHLARVVGVGTRGAGRRRSEAGRKAREKYKFKFKIY